MRPQPDRQRPASTVTSTADSLLRRAAAEAAQAERERMAGDLNTAALLEAIARGEATARDVLVERLYPELRRIARAQVGRAPATPTLDATALVHEAWIRLFGPGERRFDDRRHVILAAASAMRSAVVDHARARHTLKRGDGRRRLELRPETATYESRLEEVLALDEAIADLQASDPDGAELALLRLFGGLSCADVAHLRNVSKRTVERHWNAVHTRLRDTLRGRDSVPPPPTRR